MSNAGWFVAGAISPYLVYLAWWLASKAVAEARHNFRAVVHDSEARQIEAVSIILARRFVRLRLPGHRAVYVRSTVPTFGDPGYRLVVALSDAIDNEAP